MAVTGNGALSLRKKDLAGSKPIALGFKKLVFAYVADAATAIEVIGTRVCRVRPSAAGTIDLGDRWHFQWTADAEL